MNNRIEELQQQLDLTLRSLPESMRRRYLAEEVAAGSLIGTKKFIISELIARASDQDVLFFDVWSEVGMPGKLSYGIISVSDLLEDTPAMRAYIGGYRDNLEDFQREAANLAASVLFIRFSYSEEFVDSCGAGADALPISKMCLITN
jgi:hypothetical protein